MEKPDSHQAESFTVEASEECLVCNDEANIILKEKDISSIRKTICCKQFLCGKCHNDLLTKNLKQCPNCRKEAEFNTVSATIKKQEPPKPNAEVLSDLNQAEIQRILEEQLKIEEEIRQHNSKREAQEQELKLNLEAQECARQRLEAIQKFRAAVKEQIGSLQEVADHAKKQQKAPLTALPLQDNSLPNDEENPVSLSNMERRILFQEQEQKAAARKKLAEAVTLCPDIEIAEDLEPIQKPAATTLPLQNASPNIPCSALENSERPENQRLSVVVVPHQNRRGINIQEMLHNAILNDSSAEIKEAVRLGANINETKQNKSPLLWAVLLRKTDAVDALLDLGAKPDKTLVQHAIDLQAFRIACILVIRGNLDANNLYFFEHQHRSNSHMANLMRILIMNHHLDLADYLAQERPEFIVNCDTLVKELATKFEFNRAIAAKLLQAIINRGYNVNNIWTLSEGGNRTSLISGIYNPGVLSLFIAGGANPNTIIDINYPRPISGGDWKITPLLKAIDLCNTPAARILINAGADVNQRGNPFSHQQPMTPLAYAIQRGAADIVPLLLERGADL